MRLLAARGALRRAASLALSAAGGDESPGGRRRVALFPGLLATLLCLGACSDREPRPRAQPREQPTFEQPAPAPTEETGPALELGDVELRTDQTRVGEAVRLHVSGWRPSEGPSFEPKVELDGPATVERVGEELLEERDGRVRERVDFRIEPTGPGEVAITATATATERRGPAPRSLSLRVDAALSEAELARQLSTQAGRLARGRGLAQQGDYRRAIAVFNQMLEHERDHPAALSELGWAAFLTGDYGLARRATREGLRRQTDPRTRGALLYNLGRIAEALERDDEAIAAYRRSLAVRPDSATVRKRLERLEDGCTAPSCTAPSCTATRCPLTPPLDGIRACELIEEEGCPLLGQGGTCRCSVEELTELDAIGRWRLLTLTARDPVPEALGINQVYILLADAATEAGAEPRYHVFEPLPGSRLNGALRGGVRAAELIDVGELSVLRIDFEGTVPHEEGHRLARGWTLLCSIADGQPVCAAPLLSKYQAHGVPDFVAPVVIASDGTVGQTIESGAAPSREELVIEYRGALMQVLSERRPVADLLRSASSD